MRARPTTRRSPISKRFVIPAMPSGIRTPAFMAMSRPWVRLASRKKAAQGEILEERKAAQPGAGAHPREGGTCAGGREARADCERRAAQHQSAVLGFGHGGGMWVRQPPGPSAPTPLATMTQPYFG